MACLSPKALGELWTQMLDTARRERLGPFGWEISPECAAKIDREYDEWLEKNPAQKG